MLTYLNKRGPEAQAMPIPTSEKRRIGEKINNPRPGLKRRFERPSHNGICQNQELASNVPGS
jgi:hypothetical protein